VLSHCVGELQLASAIATMPALIVRLYARLGPRGFARDQLRRVSQPPP
jgi:hypothetical protein